MSKDYLKYKDLIHKAADMGLSGGTQLLTLIQAKDLVLAQQNKQIKEFNEWIISASKGLEREIKEIEHQNDQHLSR